VEPVRRRIVAAPGVEENERAGLKFTKSCESSERK
jgi:hypothetical protein